MNKKRDSQIAVYAISLLFFLLMTLPFVYAEISGGESHVFNGFLLNPIDGNTYLAKMYQGWEGEWRFRLPFTSEPGEGAFLFMFYLGLGHLARILNLPLLTIFHSVRIVASFLLLWSLWVFYGGTFDSKRIKTLAFGLSTLGSGLGWLFLLFGTFTADFWVAEAYPFLSTYANPHFPLGLAMVLWLVKPRKNLVFGFKEYLLVSTLACFLSVINPFGVVISLMVLAARFFGALLLKSEYKHILKIALTAAIFSIPVLVYDYWVTWSDPVLRLWNAQNLTSSPPLWELIISLSPALIFSTLGIISWARSNPDQSEDQISGIVFWAVFGLIAVYLPLSLQRRFMMGLYVPLSGLAAYGVEALAIKNSKRFQFISSILLLLSIPTNIVILLTGVNAAQTLNSQVYLSSTEVQTLAWIEANTGPDDLILASPDMGLFIPAYTGRRVIYGHPFETTYAEKEENSVLEYYQGNLSELQVDDYIRDKGVDYVFWGPRERAIGDALIKSEWDLVFQDDEVNLFQVSP